MSCFAIEQLNRSQNDIGCSYSVGDYLHSAAIEMEVADVMRMNNVDEETVCLVCDIIVDHFATAHYLEENDK